MSGLVGRTPELAVLCDALAAAAAGTGRLLLITGEPGIGKSTLVDEFVAVAGQQGARVLWGTAWEDGGAPAYWPWVQVLRPVAAELGPTAPPALVRLLPELAAPPVPAGPVADRGGSGDRFTLFDAAAAALVRAAATGPVAIVLEDLHAAGLPAALLLRFVAQHTRTAPVVLVATYREVEARLDPALGEVVAALEATGTVLALPPLSDQEVRELVAPVLPDLPERLLAAIMARTKGNPLFTTQVARVLAQVPPGDREPATAPIPAGIAQAVRQQLDRLTGGSDLLREALTASAVLGGEVELAEVAAVLGTPPVELLSALDPAVGAGLLRELAPQRYRFAHALVRDAIYSELVSTQRATWHHRVATVLADRPGTRAARLARHFLAAMPVGDAETAVTHAIEAGREAMAALAYEEAAGHFRSALSALHQLAGHLPEQRCELLLALGSALLKAADLGRAGPVLAQAVTLARACGSGELLGRAALLRAEHLDFNAVDHEAVALLTEAAGVLAGSAPPADQYGRSAGTPLLARVYARLGVALQNGDREQMVAAADRAVAVARSTGDPAVLAEALSARLHTRWGEHEPRAARAEAEEIAGLAGQAGDASLAATGHMWRFIFSLELGDVATAQHAVARVQELASRSHEPILRLLATSRAATLAAFAGRGDRALALADEAWQIGLRAGLPDADPMHWGQLYAVWRSQPLPAEHQARMERILRELASRSVLRTAHHAAQLLIGLIQGDQQQARPRLDSLVAEVPQLRRDPVYVWTLSMLAECCVRLSVAAHAESLYAALLPYADRFVVTGGVGCGEVVHHHLAGLAALAGRTGDAEEHYTVAIERHREAGAAPMLARSQQEYARLRRQRSTPEPAGPASPARPAGPVDVAELRRSGRVWNVQWDGTAATVPDSKGMRDLAILLHSPDREVHVLDLVEAAGGPPAAAAGGHAGQRLDRTARTAYRRRLAELADELADAEANVDTGRTETLRREQEFLTAELAAALGLGGRSRQDGDPVERARKSVTMRIRTALRAIAEVHPALARHLDRSVTTGRMCAYRPERPVRWQLSH